MALVPAGNIASGAAPEPVGCIALVFALVTPACTALVAEAAPFASVAGAAARIVPAAEIANIETAAELALAAHTGSVAEPAQSAAANTALVAGPVPFAAACTAPVAGPAPLAVANTAFVAGVGPIAEAAPAARHLPILGARHLNFAE